MGKGKLILICQFGGEFVENDNNTLSYNGGEANAVNVNQQTVFDDLKLKLAEMCNLDYTTISIKYFLPGNRRNLIILKNDKDFKRMIDFHGNSVTADIFVMGKTGFNPDALKMHANRGSGIKLAETVNYNVTPIPPANSSPMNAADSAGLKVASPVTTIPRKRGRKKKTAVPSGSSSLVSLATSVTAVNAAEGTPTEATPVSTPDCSAEDDSDYAPRSVNARNDSSSRLNTPADTVKKRRRSASWKVGVTNSHTAIVTTGTAGKRRSWKRNRRCITSEADDVSLINDDSLSSISICENDSLEKVVASWKDGIIGVGQEFKSVKEFRDTLQKYAIAHRFSYKLKKNDTNRASGRCVTEGCSWRIHASWVSTSQSFVIKKFNNLHTCDEESRKSAHPTKNWLVNIIKDRLQESPHHKPKDIASGILRDFGIELNYTQVWRGLEDAREQLQGSHKEAYNQLPRYCKRVLETNPGSSAELVIGTDKKFRCLFICFHASKQGFQNGCRPLLFLEASSLRSKYQEILLSATAIDGDDRFVPVAFAVVHTENDDNWRWFLEHLKLAIATPNSITFVYDREKGLQEMLQEVFDNGHCGYNMFHLIESFKKNFRGPFHGDGKGSLHSNFLAAAHALRAANFKKFTEQIKLVSPQTYDWVMQIEPEYWTSFSFKGEPFNHILENVGEMYIKLMEDVRESPIIYKIEALTSMMIELINDRRMEASKWSTKLTPSKEEKLQEETINARNLKVLISSDILFEVHDDSIHVLNISNSDCSCLNWKETGLPCCHAIAVFRRIGKSVYDYCPRYFTIDFFNLTYSESINPVLESGTPMEKVEADSSGKSLENEEARSNEKPLEKEEAKSNGKPFEKEEARPSVAASDKEMVGSDEKLSEKEVTGSYGKPSERVEAGSDDIRMEMVEAGSDAIPKPMEMEEASSDAKPIDMEEAGLDAKPMGMEEARSNSKPMGMEDAESNAKPMEMEEARLDATKPIVEEAGTDGQLLEMEETGSDGKPLEKEKAVSNGNPLEKEEAVSNSNLEKEEAGSDNVLVLPPCAPRPLNQEKKERMAVDENKRTVTCSRCKEPGHNKASCKARI